MSTASLDPSDIWPGRLCDWLHTPRGGYGYTVRVPAKVIRTNGQRVTIEAIRADGSGAIRTVRADSLVATRDTEAAIARALIKRSRADD